MNLPVRELKQLYGFNKMLPLPGKRVTGSRNRAIERYPVETDKGSFIINVLSSEMVPRKKQILETLYALQNNGLLGIEEYLPAKNGSLFVSVNGFNFLTAHLYKHNYLERPTAFHNPLIGKNAANFLISLYQHTDKTARASVSPGPNLPDFIEQLFRQLARSDFSISCKVLPFLKMLKKNYFPQESKLRRVICHGDFHPLNILWENFQIVRVIDWEFCGTNSILYDAANFAGCIGFDDPALSNGPAVRAFIDALQEKLLLQNEIAWLSYAILANRFGWLAEWIKEKDENLISQELEYMWLIAQNCH